MVKRGRSSRVNKDTLGSIALEGDQVLSDRNSAGNGPASRDLSLHLNAPLHRPVFFSEERVGKGGREWEREMSNEM